MGKGNRNRYILLPAQDNGFPPLPTPPLLPSACRENLILNTPKSELQKNAKIFDVSSLLKSEKKSCLFYWVAGGGEGGTVGKEKEGRKCSE